MPTADINGATLKYQERGSGEPVVLVHGSVSDYRVWDAQFGPFARHYRTIRYSRRYHWPNAPIADGDDYPMLEQVDDLQAFVHTLDLAPVHLVGHSYGGFLALLLAIREPGALRSLVLMEPPALTLFCSLPPKPMELLKLFVTRPRTAATIAKFGATGVGPTTEAYRRGDVEEGIRRFGQAVLGPETFANLPEARLEQIRANVITAEFLGSGFAPISANDVRGVRTPTLLVTGDRSPAIFLRVTDYLAELLPNVERVEIPHASHGMQEMNPSAYNTAVLAFLQKHAQSA